MGSVYRKTITRRLPAKAKLTTKSGELIATWTDVSGKKQTGVVFTRPDGEQRVRTKTGTYTASYRDGVDELREVATGCRTRDAALARLNELMSRAEKVRSGALSIEDERVADHRHTPLVELVEEYAQLLQAKNRSATHIADCRRLTARVFGECKLISLRDLQPEPVERWLQERAEKKMSARTRNSYLQAVRGFCRWCVMTGRLNEDPTRRLEKAAEHLDRRRERRAMTGEELQKLLFVARWRPLAEYGRKVVKSDQNESNSRSGRWARSPLSFESIDAALVAAKESLRSNPNFIIKLERRGLERALAYKLMALTGLRRGEVASLLVRDLSLETTPPVIRLDAKSAKNRRSAEIPLRPDLADDLRNLRDYRARIEESSLQSLDTTNLDISEVDRTPLLDVPQQLVKSFDRDLKVAGIAKRDDRGRTIDIHALRHSFATLLSAGGAAPRVAQAALRHSDIGLTMNVYTDPRLLDISSALTQLPKLSLNYSPTHRPPTLQRQARDRKRSKNALSEKPVAVLVAVDSGQPGNLEQFGANSTLREVERANQKTPRKQAFSGVSQGVADGARTRDLRNHNPML